MSKETNDTNESTGSKHQDARGATDFDVGYSVGWELRQDGRQVDNPYPYGTKLYNGFREGWKSAGISISNYVGLPEEIPPYEEYKNPHTDIFGLHLHVEDIVAFSGIGHAHTLTVGKVVDFNDENMKVVVEYTEYYPVEKQTTAEYFSRKGEFNTDGLFSETIFNAVGSLERKKTFSYINLHVKVIHPIALDIILKLY